MRPPPHRSEIVAGSDPPNVPTVDFPLTGVAGTIDARYDFHPARYPVASALTPG
jgi:hypothetical protein